MRLSRSRALFRADLLAFPTLDVMPIWVTTDPGLPLGTPKGTGCYEVPSLKGRWYRGRCLHDGGFASLEELFCAGCHGATGVEGKAPILKSKSGPDVELWARGRILPLRAPFATTVWDYLNRAMPLNRGGTLPPPTRCTR